MALPWEHQSGKKEATQSEAPVSFLCSWGLESATPTVGSPWRLRPVLGLLMPSSPGLRVLVLSLPGPLTGLSSSFSSGQDCENYITLLERQGERLLACGTNARRPSCWSLVRRPLPYAWSAHLCLGGLLPPPGGGLRGWPHLVQNAWGMGTLAGKRAPWAADLPSWSPTGKWHCGVTR